MRLLIEQDRMIRLPANMPQELRQVERGDRAEKQRHKDAKDATQVASLDKPIGGEDEETTLLHTMRANTRDALTEFRFKRMREDIEIAVLSLSDNQRRVINDYYGLQTGWGLTLEQIAKEMGYTGERIRQLRNQGLQRLSYFKDLKKYLRLF